MEPVADRSIVTHVRARPVSLHTASRPVLGVRTAPAPSLERLAVCPCPKGENTAGQLPAEVLPGGPAPLGFVFRTDL